ncbi:MAG: NYN domain-containing protein [Candidatus Methylomirabilales bacterium]
MRIIVDGYNLIRRSPELSMLDREDLEQGREGLLRLLASYQRLKGHRITAVFDGREGGSPIEQQKKAGGVAVVFSKRGESADQVIVRLSTSGAVVVTSDRELQKAVERTGAFSVDAEAFLARVEEALYRRMKGLEDEEEATPAKRKGPARRPSKAARRREERLRKL